MWIIDARYIVRQLNFFEYKKKYLEITNMFYSRKKKLHVNVNLIDLKNLKTNDLS